MVVELPFVLGGAEPVGFSLVDGTGCAGRIDFHVANDAESVSVRGGAEFCIFRVGISIEPAASLVFHAESGLGSGGAAVVAFDDAEGEIDAGREPAGGSQITVLDETSAALYVNVGIRDLKTHECAVISGGGFAGEQAGFGQ